MADRTVHRECSAALELDLADSLDTPRLLAQLCPACFANRTAQEPACFANRAAQEPAPLGDYSAHRTDGG